MSDVGFKKHCVKANVPVPQRGYWAKLAAGKPTIKILLSPRAPGKSNEVEIGPAKLYRWEPDPIADLAEPEPIAPHFAESIDELESRVRKYIGKVTFILDLSQPCPEIRKLLDQDEERKRKLIQEQGARSTFLQGSLFRNPNLSLALGVTECRVIFIAF